MNIGLNETQRKPVIDILNRLLADEVLLYVKTRNYHWNVTGPQFSELHKFFEAQYDELDEIMDEVAERARALGGRAAGSMGEFLKQARLKESTGSIEARSMIAELLADHETLVRAVREDAAAAGDKYADAGTENFLVGLMEQHEKMAWMLRAYVS
jgi:starvation-inducible DNA-binding protein